VIEEYGMPEGKRRQAGLDKFNEVYGGRLPAPPEGTMPFFDVMLEQLFGEVWTRPALAQRDRRLLVMGVTAALGEREAFGVQVRSAIENGELTGDQCREVLIHLAQYVGYPRISGLVGLVEQIIGEVGAS
jgi:4-carboxymuconolactone decarboxylase